MRHVWLLWFEQERPDAEDTLLLIGVYRTRENAEAAIDRVKDQPGFRDFPEGFTISEYVIDEDRWREGFIRA